MAGLLFSGDGFPGGWMWVERSGFAAGVSWLEVCQRVVRALNGGLPGVVEALDEGLLVCWS